MVLVTHSPTETPAHARIMCVLAITVKLRPHCAINERLYPSPRVTKYLEGPTWLLDHFFSLLRNLARLQDQNRKHTHTKRDMYALFMWFLLIPSVMCRISYRSICWSSLALLNIYSTAINSCWDMQFWELRYLKCHIVYAPQRRWLIFWFCVCRYFNCMGMLLGAHFRIAFNFRKGTSLV